MRSKLVIVNLLIVLLLIASLAACAGSGKTAGRVVDDSVITTKVKALLIEDDALKSFSIEVKTYQGVVQLSGFVNSAATVSRAGQLARSVDGVKQVKNDLIIK